MSEYELLKFSKKNWIGFAPRSLDVIKSTIKTRTQMRNCAMRNCATSNFAIRHDVICFFMIVPFMAIQYLFKILCMIGNMLDYIHDGYYNILSPIAEHSIFGMVFCDIGWMMIGMVVIVTIVIGCEVLYLKYMCKLYWIWDTKKLKTKKTKKLKNNKNNKKG